jgi:hypothetical protein
MRVITHTGNREALIKSFQEYCPNARTDRVPHDAVILDVVYETRNCRVVLTLCVFLDLSRTVLWEYCVE